MPLPEQYQAGEDDFFIDVVGDVTPSEGLYARGRFEKYLKGLAEKAGVDPNQAFNYPFGEVKEFFEQSYTIANFESSVLADDVIVKAADYKEPKSVYSSGKFPNFHFPASEYTAQTVYPQYSSVEAVSLANNHFRDFGIVGMRTSMEALSFGGLACFGAGQTKEEAFSPRIEEYKGKKIALIGLSTVVGPDEPDAPLQENLVSQEGPFIAAYKHSGEGVGKHKEFLRAAIGKAKEQQADIVIVYYHWGTESEQVPADYQRELARYAANEGADLVVGAHQHVIQGVEEYQVPDSTRVVPIAYGLGNFMFAGNYNPREKRSIVFRLKYKITPEGRLEPDGYTIVPVVYTKSQDAGAQAYQNIEQCFDSAGRFRPKFPEGEPAMQILDLVAQRSDKIPQESDVPKKPVHSGCQIGQMRLQIKQREARKRKKLSEEITD